MLKNLLEKLTGLKQLFVKAPAVAPVVEAPRPKVKINVKKAFATVRLKNGDNLISKEFFGTLTKCPGYSEDFLLIKSGREVLVDFFERFGDQESFIDVRNDRLVRGVDIFDIFGIVESDHEIEV